MALDGRWRFAVGAILASVAWFSGLGFGARVLAPVFSRPRAWQLLELLIAATMVLIAVKLAISRSSVFRALREARTPA